MKLRSILKSFTVNDPSLINEINQINIHRIFFYAAFAIPIHIAIIILFLFNLHNETGIVYRWRLGIIMSHFTGFVFISIIGLIVYCLNQRGKDNIKYHSIIQNTVYITYLMLGVVICSIDQMVSPGITAFLIACTCTATMFVIKPVIAVTYYTINYVLFYFLVSLTQPNKDMLLSIRVNGIAAVGIGLCIALVLWSSNISNLKQSRLIDNQKKELEEKNKQLEYMATHDQLTGLINRAQFIQFAEKEIARIRRSGTEASIILVDIDIFKNVNDNYGHPTGDTVLKNTAGIIKKSLREMDIPARFGGEEFIILLPETPAQGGAVVAEKIRANIADYPFKSESQTIHITSSFGVTAVTASESESFDLSYQRVDEALYIAKRNGRNRVEIYNCDI
jgi:diguanylate cyclase (GGDEF) domain